jgi:hypothetical protein
LRGRRGNQLQRSSGDDGMRRNTAAREGAGGLEVHRVVHWMSVGGISQRLACEKAKLSEVVVERDKKGDTCSGI